MPRWLIWGLGLILAAMLAVAGWWFGPRYFYKYFGHMALAEAKSTMTEAQAEAIRDHIGGLRARVAWGSSRSGNHELYLMELPQVRVRRLTNNHFVDFYPRFSPDGAKLVFARSTTEWVSERETDGWDAWVLDLNTGQESLAAKGGNFPAWLDDHTISFQRDDKVWTRDLATGQETMVMDGGPAFGGGLSTPMFSPLTRQLIAVTARGDKLSGVFVMKMRNMDPDRYGAGGCQISFFPGGERLYWVEPEGHGGTRIMEAVQGNKLPARVFMDRPGQFSHEYFPHLSDDGQWLVWGASAGGHEHDIADYEIFLWRVGAPWGQNVRLTYNPANDRWPDIHIME